MIRVILLTIFIIFMFIGKLFQCNSAFKLFNAHGLLCAPHPLVDCMFCSLVIQQSPKHLLQTMEEKEAKLSCHHGDSSYSYMYWYQQKSNGGSLELIGMLIGDSVTPEDKFKPRFDLSGQATKDASLRISSISAEDSAVYFCAASMHSCTIHYKPWQITVHFAPAR